MKATGIVRRIDELGRVVIPKEIRRTLRIREGDPLEIFTDKEGGIMLKKYSPVGELADFSREFAEALYKSCGVTAVICDRDTIVASAGQYKKDYIGGTVSDELEHMMDERRVSIFSASNSHPPVPIKMGEDASLMTSQIIAPVVCDGQPAGAVCLVSRKKEESLAQMEARLAEIAANVLGAMMEQ